MDAMGPNASATRFAVARGRRSGEFEYRLSAIMGYASLIACGVGVIKILF